MLRPEKEHVIQSAHFSTRKKKENETISQFVTRLRQLAIFCDFPAESIDSFIQDQVIDNCSSTKLRTKLLAERDLTLDRMLDIAQAMEASESQSRQIAEDNQFTNVYSINRQTRGGKRGQRERQNPSKSKEKQCFRCGIKGHSGDDCRCSRNVTCFKCGKPGHFASMCRSKTPQGGQTNLDLQRGPHFDKGNVKGKSRGNRVRYVDEQTLPPLRDTFRSPDSDSDDAYTDGYAFAVQRNASTFPVEINGLLVGVIIDSGASCNIVNSAVADQLRDIGSRFQKCQRFIHPYRSTPIECKEYLTAEISVSGV